MPAPSTPQTIPDVTEDIETGSGSGLRRSWNNGIFDQIRANDAVYFCFGLWTAIGHERKFGGPSRIEFLYIDRRSGKVTSYALALNDDSNVVPRF